jgi:shikimate kinase
VAAGTRPIVLVGLMGAGKTTVGRALARTLGVPFVDNDEMLKARRERVAREIAAHDGPGALHRAEAAVAREALADPTPRVIALPASVADDEDLLAELRRHDVVWLRAPAATLQARVRGHRGHRPSAADLGETLEQQSQRRAGAFAAAASRIVDVDGRTPDDVVDEITADQRA